MRTRYWWFGADGNYHERIGNCQTIYDDSGDSAGPAEVPPPPGETVEEAVTRCAKKLGVTIDAFSASSKGTNGYARISGSGTIRGVGVGLANYSITNDVNSFSGPELEELGRTSADMGITFEEGDLVATLRSGKKVNKRVGPSTNYTGNNLSNNRAILASQVHELGNSIYLLLGERLDKVSGDSDAGASFEDCVFGGRIGKDGKLHS